MPKTPREIFIELYNTELKKEQSVNKALKSLVEWIESKKKKMSNYDFGEGGPDNNAIEAMNQEAEYVSLYNSALQHLKDEVLNG